MSVYDVNANELVEKAAEELKKVSEIKAPVWAAYAKTGVNKERPPLKNDWWYMRAAALLRSIYVLGPIGVNKLRVKYGSKKNMGHAPDRVYKSSGNIIRKCMQQLEKAGFISEINNTKRKIIFRQNCKTIRKKICSVKWMSSKS
jgi:small subunit ribosomal protein S19e